MTTTADDVKKLVDDLHNQPPTIGAIVQLLVAQQMLARSSLPNPIKADITAKYSESAFLVARMDMISKVLDLGDVVEKDDSIPVRDKLSVVMAGILKLGLKYEERESTLKTHIVNLLTVYEKELKGDAS